MNHFALEVLEREIDGQLVPVLKVTEGVFFRLFRLQEISSLTLEPISSLAQERAQATSEYHGVAAAGYPNADNRINAWLKGEGLSLEQANRMTDAELLRLPNMGPVCVRRIRERSARGGLRGGEDSRAAENAECRRIVGAA